MRKILHVVRNKSTDNWDVKEKKSNAILASFDLKQKAVESAVSLAKAYPLGQVKIHGLDGKIQSERTYGKDPEKYLG